MPTATVTVSFGVAIFCSVTGCALIFYAYFAGESLVSKTFMVEDETEFTITVPESTKSGGCPYKLLARQQGLGCEDVFGSLSATAPEPISGPIAVVPQCGEAVEEDEAENDPPLKRVALLEPPVVDGSRVTGTYKVTSKTELWAADGCGSSRNDSRGVTALGGVFALAFLAFCCACCWFAAAGAFLKRYGLKEAALPVMAARPPWQAGDAADLAAIPEDKAVAEHEARISPAAALASAVATAPAAAAKAVVNPLLAQTHHSRHTHHHHRRHSPPLGAKTAPTRHTSRHAPKEVSATE